MHSNIPFQKLWQPALSAVPGFTLHYAGTSTVLATVIPDDTWPGMFRIHWPDGAVSDIGNLSRVRDAAEAIAERGPPHRKAKLLGWRQIIKLSRRAHKSPLVRFSGHAHQDASRLQEIGGVQ